MIEEFLCASIVMMIIIMMYDMRKAMLQLIERFAERASPVIPPASPGLPTFSGKIPTSSPIVDAEPQVATTKEKAPHLFGSMKYNADMVKAVYADRKNLSIIAVSEKYGISQSAVSYMTQLAKKQLGIDELAREKRGFEKYSRETHENILSDRENGLSYNEISVKYAIPTGSLAKIFSRAVDRRNKEGLQVRMSPQELRRGGRQSDRERTVAIYNDLTTLGTKKTSEKYGIGKSQVYNLASKARYILGIPKLKGGRNNSYPHSRLKVHSDAKASAVLNDVELGFSHDGVARRHKVSRGTINWLINRGKEIRRKLEKKT